MRFLAPTALLAAAVLVLACSILQPPAVARATAATPARTGATHTAVAAPAVTGAGQGRLVTPGTVQPQIFFGKWWKKFKRVIQRIFDFIDGLLDDLKPHPGDEPTTPPTTAPGSRAGIADDGIPPAAAAWLAGRLLA
jgi:hypothetical protein